MAEQSKFEARIAVLEAERLEVDDAHVKQLEAQVKKVRCIVSATALTAVMPGFSFY